MSDSEDGQPIQFEGSVKTLIFDCSLKFIQDIPHNEIKELPAISYDGLDFIIVIKHTSNGSFFLVPNLKICMPKSLKKIISTHILMISHPSEEPSFLNCEKYETLVYDQSEINYSESSATFYCNVNRLPIDPMGNFKIHLHIKSLKKTLDFTHGLKKLQNQINPNPEERIYMKSELINLNLKLAQNSLLVKQKKVQLETNQKLETVANQQQIELITTKGNLEANIRKLKAKISPLKQRIIILKKELADGNINQFMRKFNQMDVKFDQFTINQLKLLLNKNLQMQLRVSQQISEEELCAICMDRRRNLALVPCGHLYFCTDCGDDLNINNTKTEKAPICPICSNDYHGTLIVKY